MNSSHGLLSARLPSPIGSRQIGKTSLLQKIQAIVESSYGWASALIDLSTINDPAADLKAWAALFCRSLVDQLRAFLKEEPDLPVPATSIYSRTDGIVNWRTCLLRPSDTAENIEVHLASHVGLGVNAAALWAVADRLAQREGEFRQFDRSGPFAIAYAPPENAQS